MCIDLNIEQVVWGQIGVAYFNLRFRYMIYIKILEFSLSLDCGYLVSYLWTELFWHKSLLLN